MLKSHVPCLVSLVTNIKVVHQGLAKCPQEWQELCKAISSALTKMLHTSILSDAASMMLLQQEVPVLFTLLENLPHYPTELIEPIICRLIAVSLAPFKDPAPVITSPEISTTENQLAFFPQLKSLRARKSYSEDRSSSRICTKKSSGHPSLLPGIFTFFASTVTYS